MVNYSTGAAMTLDKDALHAAVAAYEASPCMDLEGPMEAAIEAYLAALPKEGLAGRLLKTADDLDETIAACDPDHKRVGGNLDILRQEVKDLREAAAALQGLEGWPDTLPCDVTVASSTVLRKGVNISTLQLALNRRATPGGRDGE